MKNHLLLFCIFISIFSCTKHPADNTIRPLETTSGGFTAKVTRSVPLSSVKDALIDRIYMLEYYQNRFYTLDEGEYLVLIFNPDGSLANRINRGNSITTI